MAVALPNVNVKSKLRTEASSCPPNTPAAVANGLTSMAVNLDGGPPCGGKDLTESASAGLGVNIVVNV